MTIKIGYSYEKNDGNTLSSGANESTVSGVNRLELVKWMGAFFLEDLYKLEKNALTLNITISDETPENTTFISDLLFKGLTKQGTVVTKLNIAPQNLFSKEQYDVINQRLADNLKALPVSVSNKEEANVDAQNQKDKPKAKSVRRGLHGLLVLAIFVGLFAFTSFVTALVSTIAIALVARMFVVRTIDDSVIPLKKLSDTVLPANTLVDVQQEKNCLTQFNQLKTHAHLAEAIKPSSEMVCEAKNRYSPS